LARERRLHGRAGVTKFVECGAGKVLAGLLNASSPASPGLALARRAILTLIAPSSDEKSRVVYGSRASTRLATKNDQKDMGEAKMFDLTGKTALVTGASGGIGRDIARSLHGAGAACGAFRHAREALEAAAAELARGSTFCPATSARRSRPKSSCRKPRRRSAVSTFLVNNAGITRDMLFMRMKDEDWDTVLNVNLTAAFRLSRRRCAA